MMFQYGLENLKAYNSNRLSYIDIFNDEAEEQNKLDSGLIFD